jgi:hypothetical protein
MHVSSKARRAISNINAFLSKTELPQGGARGGLRRVSYETTKTSLQIYLGELNTLLYKENRREDSRGSHYVSCSPGATNCRCFVDNSRIEAIASEVQRLLRGVS